MRYLLRHARITIAQFVWICAVAILVLALFYLAVTGRLHWLFALTAAALPFARRLLPLLRFIPFLRQLAGVFGHRHRNRYRAEQARRDIRGVRSG
jgi:hypothetical protein